MSLSTSSRCYADLTREQLDFFRLPDLRHEADNYTFLINALTRTLYLAVLIPKDLPDILIPARLINLCAIKELFKKSQAKKQGYSIKIWVISDRNTVEDEHMSYYDGYLMYPKLTNTLNSGHRHYKQ